MTYSYIITDTKQLHSRIDYVHANERTCLHPEYSLLSSAYLETIAREQNTDERGALAYLGVTIGEDEAQWLIGL